MFDGPPVALPRMRPASSATEAVTPSSPSPANRVVIVLPNDAERGPDVWVLEIVTVSPPALA